ncbi:hypothetical protein [Mycolicibacterium austroafricanum]|uniref:hypothetical protein n=1 Tax=Mycolicibacterium austroafricanum TaxID=39687 RepID=UPI001056EB24|nr:hypothetical protein [Mycolicibacterium austroafricanum]
MGVLTQTTEKTASYTAAPNEQVLINAITPMTITMPASPAMGDLVGTYIRAGTSEVTLAANAGQELRYDGSAVASMALQGSGGTVGLSLWSYQSTGAAWALVSYTVAPASTDVVDSSSTGRVVLTGDANAGRSALSAASAAGSATGLWMGSSLPGSGQTGVLYVVTPS